MWHAGQRLMLTLCSFLFHLIVYISTQLDSPFSGGSASISQFCLLMLKRELIWRRSFLVNGPARFRLFVRDVGGGVWLLFRVGGVVVTVMLGGDWNEEERRRNVRRYVGYYKTASSTYFWRGKINCASFLFHLIMHGEPFEYSTQQPKDFEQAQKHQIHLSIQQTIFTQLTTHSVLRH